MKTAWIMVVILGCVASLYAQPGPDTLWTRTYGWSGNDTAFGLQQTFDGGFILAGTATIPVDPPHTDVFTIKTDGQGSMQGWRSYGGPGNQGAYDVVQLYDGGYILAGYATPIGSDNSDLWLMRLAPDVSSVENSVVLHPSSFILSVYPNPFNPVTEIRYDLVASAHVSLGVYDLLAREVAMLKDEFSQAGSHRVTFDGSGLVSGIYFARLDAGTFSQTMKLVLLK